ncbi:hypothetical protein QUB08_03005 [Microcoleus sp. BR0-C5]|uniref:hypothetical protein n=1 Tax=Microcoleus sp. BR0-C5 TaxID=2818713 RepID=UPI002FCF472D
MLNSVLILPIDHIKQSIAKEGKKLILPKDHIKESIADEGKQLIDIQLYKRTKDLIKLLEDVGIIYFDSTIDMYSYNPFIKGDHVKKRFSLMVSKMLGYTAEGIVVRECNSDLNKNAKWANIARFLKEEQNFFTNLVKKIFWYPLLQKPDEYRAIGTGFAKTFTENPTWYSYQSPRDICWIDNATRAIELLVPKNITAGKRKNAGIQIKVSSGRRGNYVTDYFKTKHFSTLYPVVYFDLGNDFNIVRNKLLSSSLYPVERYSIFSSDVQFLEGYSKNDVVDLMLHRGRDVDPSLHEELLYYKSVFTKLVSSDEINLLDLSDENVIFGLLTNFLGRNMVEDSSILTISYSR